MNNLRSIIPFKDQIKLVISAITGKPNKGNGEFCNRIKTRHRTFWKSPDAEIVRNTKMDANDPLEKWQDVVNWQRKLSNKYNSREFAKLHNCLVPELYWKGRDVSAIDFSKLPSYYVIRPTIGHASGLVFLMNNSLNMMDGKTYTPESIKTIMAKAIAENDKLEFLIEEFLKTEKGEYKIPEDYKIYIFNGEIAAIQVINRLSPTKGYTTFYDENWNQISNLTIFYPKGTYQEPPKCLADMVRQAKELSKSYGIFARIDFYATDKGAVFGEFTPTPSMGNYFTPAADKMLVQYWDKFCYGKI